MCMSESVKEISKALAEVQKKIKHPIKNKQNSHLKSKYADILAVIEAAIESLSDSGLSFTQTTKYKEGLLVLETILLHSSGEWIRSEYPIFPEKNTPQSYGAALTYARRYSLSCALGMAADEDDDGYGLKSLPTKKTETYESASVKLRELAANGDKTGCSDFVKQMLAEKVFAKNDRAIAEAKSMLKDGK